MDWEADNTFKRDATKLFVEFRSEINGNESRTYEDCEELMRFIDRYAVHNVGTRELYKYLKAKPGNTLLDCLTVYDIAYMILVYENTVLVWDELMRYRSRTKPRAKKLLHHAKRGTKLREFLDGWTQDGRQYYSSLVKMVKGWKSNDAFWETIQEHWREYAKLNHSSISVHNGASMEVVNDIEEDDEDVKMMDFTQV